MKSPLSVRIPLVDPDRFLDVSLPAIRFLFTRGFFCAWLALVSLALLLAGSNWSELSEAVRWNTLSPGNLVLLWLAYPVVKLLHELGHAYTAKLEGGEVHEMGVLFMVFLPIPYVDASAAAAFEDSRKRLLVGAAGIMVELLLASLALLLWLAIEPGLLRDICLNVMLIGGVSTLLFNGNPLLRFDGYYMLADALGIPNLAQRSNSYLAFLVQRYVFGMAGARSPVTAQGEAGWFFFYAIASFLYRLFILSVICLFLIDELFIAGVVLAIWIVTSQLLLPVIRMLSFVLASPSLRERRRRAVLSSTLVTAALIAALFGLPVRSLTQFEGVIQPPEQSHLVIQTDSFVESVLVEPGSRVEKGQALVRLQNIDHQAEMAVNRAHLRELSARLNEAQVNDRVQINLVRDEIAALEARNERIQQKLDALTIRSPMDGEFVLPQAEDLPGQHLQQGTLLGYVVDTQHATARILVTQDDLNRVTESIRGIELRLASDIANVLEGQLLREVPQARTRLPSPVLSTEGGGPFLTDPQGNHPLATRERLFEFEVTLPLSVDQAKIGTRVYVRFDHGAETPYTQLQRGFRQLFLRRLNS